MNLTELFTAAVERQASDIHLASDEVPRLRISGDLVPLEQAPVPREEMVSALETVFPGLRTMERSMVERTVLHEGHAFVGVAFRSRADGWATTFRVLQKQPPILEKLASGRAFDLFERIAALPRGLVLICGTVGSGKWTTVCALVDRINQEKASRIFVVEAHQNYVFESKRGLVSQLHVGEDCESYLQALTIAHQADLDVVVLDDIPTLEALRMALTLAETGHLLVANLHATSAIDAIERLLGSAGLDAKELQSSLARNLVAVEAQQLVPRADRPGRVAVYEWLEIGSQAREALARGDLNSLRLLQVSGESGLSLEQSLVELIKTGEVDRAALKPDLHQA